MKKRLYVVETVLQLVTVMHLQRLYGKPADLIIAYVDRDFRGEIQERVQGTELFEQVYQFERHWLTRVDNLYQKPLWLHLAQKLRMDLIGDYLDKPIFPDEYHHVFCNNPDFVRLLGRGLKRIHHREQKWTKAERYKLPFQVSLFDEGTGSYTTGYIRGSANKFEDVDVYLFHPSWAPYHHCKKHAITTMNLHDTEWIALLRKVFNVPEDINVPMEMTIVFDQPFRDSSMDDFLLGAVSEICKKQRNWFVKMHPCSKPSKRRVYESAGWKILDEVLPTQVPWELIAILVSRKQWRYVTLSSTATIGETVYWNADREGVPTYLLYEAYRKYAGIEDCTGITELQPELRQFFERLAVEHEHICIPKDLETFTKIV